MQHHGTPPLPPSKVGPHHERRNDEEVSGSPPIDAPSPEQQPPKNQAEADDAKKAGRSCRKQPVARTTRWPERRPLETGESNDGQDDEDGPQHEL